SKALRSSFWTGAAVGGGGLAVQLEVMHVCGWFDYGTVQLRGSAIVVYGVVWAFMFLCVGIIGEGLLRGYSPCLPRQSASTWKGQSPLGCTPLTHRLSVANGWQLTLIIRTPWMTCSSCSTTWARTKSKRPWR